MLLHSKQQKSSDGGQKCSLCRKEDSKSNIVYKSENELKNHIQSNHSTNSDAWNCTQCGFQGSSESTLNKHMKYEHGNKNTNKLLSCEYCTELFSSQWNLDHHNQESHSRQTAHAHYKNFKKDQQQAYITCTVCNFRAINRSTLASHIENKHKKNTNVETFCCTICDEDFSTKSKLSKHMKVHHSEDSSNKCTECEETCLNQWSLKNHLRDNHEVTEVCTHFQKDKCKFPDNVCWLKHSKSTRLNMTNEKDIKCHICKHDFKSKNSMMLHRKKHHPEETSFCKKYKEGNCDFNTCWYIHRTIYKHKESDTDSSTDGENIGQGFHKRVPPNKTK